MREFSFVVGNPPYQIKVGERKTGQDHNLAVYQTFYEAATLLGERRSFVLPGGWQGNIGEGFAAKTLLPSGLKSVNFFQGEEIFGASIRKDYPIAILSSIEGYTGPVFANGVENNRDQEYWGHSEIEKILVEKTKSAKNLSLKIKHITELKNLESQSIELSDDGEVSLFIKKTAGPAADSGYYFITGEEALKHFENKDIESYKVTIPWRFFVQSRLFSSMRDSFDASFEFKVFGANEVFAQTRMLVESFKTKEEAVNFSNYLSSKIISRLIAMKKSQNNFASLAPDLEDYTNDNPLFTPDSDLPEGHEYKGLSLDERLYKHFKLSEEEISLIENEDGDDE